MEAGQGRGMEGGLGLKGHALRCMGWVVLYFVQLRCGGMEGAEREKIVLASLCYARLSTRGGYA